MDKDDGAAANTSTTAATHVDASVCAAQATAATMDAVEVPCTLRQTLLTFVLDESKGTQQDNNNNNDNDNVVQMHVAVQCFADYVWLIVSEADQCVPGVVLRHAASFALPMHTSLYTDVAASVGCEVLLGMRDHVLTNVVANALVRAMRERAGERQRSLLMCIHVKQVANRLPDAATRMRFVAAVQETALQVAAEAARV